MSRPLSSARSAGRRRRQDNSTTMKTLIKIVVGLVVLVAAVAACGYGYIMFAYPKVPPATAFKIEPTPERLARGKYLNDHVVGCTTCHSQRDWTRFAGPVKEEGFGA